MSITSTLVRTAAQCRAHRRFEGAAPQEPPTVKVGDRRSVGVQAGEYGGVGLRTVGEGYQVTNGTLVLGRKGAALRQLDALLARRPALTFTE
jgi:hypothetical protein